MFRTAGMTLGLLAMLAMAVACSDDTSDKDTGSGNDTGTTADQGVNPDTTPAPDKLQPDTAPPTPRKATSNSGKICKAQNECATGEICIAFSSGATQGMCLGTCVPDTTKPMTDTINVCPVSDTKTQLSNCSGGYKNNQTGATGYMCLWICEDSNSSPTKTYKCPNDTNFECKAGITRDTKLKHCVPK